MKRKLDTVLIIGVGLIGGSLAKAIKKNKLAKTVLGVSRKKETLLKAKKNKVIDQGSTQLEKLIPKADLIVLAAPISQIYPIAKKVAQFKKETAVVTDISSVKKEIVSRCESLFKGKFVGGHPMAGSENKGVEFADANLFKGAVCILTPTSKTEKESLRLVRELWKAVGSKVELLTAEAHDNVTAYISQFPHLLSSALVCSLKSNRFSANKYLKYAGSGFRDMSRIAAGDPGLWTEILMSNRRNIQNSIKKMISLLNTWDHYLETKNETKAFSFLKQAKSIRRKHY